MLRRYVALSAMVRLRRLAALAAVLVGTPVLTFGLAAGIADASVAIHVRIYAGIDDPAGITAGPDGTVWFINQGNNSIGRLSATGKITIYAGRNISNPKALAAGPGGAMWFTNPGNHTIGRITATGQVTLYSRAAISSPGAITAGPDGALWFTNGDSIGRITTSGQVTSYTDPSIDQPGCDHRWPGWGAVVHQPGQQHDRADHHHRAGHQLHRPEHQ